MPALKRVVNTVQDALAQWDRGEPVWTLLRGGLSDTYEDAIHALVFELLRKMADVPLNPIKAWDAKATEVRRRFNYPYDYSFAQVGAANQFAYFALRDGWGKTLRDAERRGMKTIQITKRGAKDGGAA